MRGGKEGGKTDGARRIIPEIATYRGNWGQTVVKKNQRIPVISAESLKMNYGLTKTQINLNRSRDFHSHR